MMGILCVNSSIICIIIFITWPSVVAQEYDYDYDYDYDGDGYAYYETTKYPPTDCDMAFSSSHGLNGTFTSPGYPRPYPGGLNCKYSFEGAGRQRVQITFHNLDLHYPTGDPNDPFDCEGMDSVTITLFINNEPQNLGVYCGRKPLPMFMSNNNYMEVTFNSHDASTATGFTASYSFVTDFGIKSGEQDMDMVCGFKFLSASSRNGTFTSPNFPGLYPRNTECHYLFYGQENDRVHITFPYFDVEGIAPPCIEDTQSDYIEFSNFHIKLKDRKMNRLCGTTRESSKMKAVGSDGNYFRVTFKSNDIYDATGFEAFYQFRYFEDPYSPKSRKTSNMITGGAAVRLGPASAVLLILVSLLIAIGS